MAEDTNREQYTGSDNMNMRGRGDSGMGGGSQGGHRQQGNTMNVNSRFEKFYNLIDAVIDQVDMSQGRNRALKYGIRAIGEFIADMPEPGRGQHTNEYDMDSPQWNEYDEGRKTKSKSKENKGSNVSRRG